MPPVNECNFVIVDIYNQMERVNTSSKEKYSVPEQK